MLFLERVQCLLNLLHFLFSMNSSIRCFMAIDGIDPGLFPILID